jgi:hypothetical protein
MVTKVRTRLESYLFFELKLAKLSAIYGEGPYLNPLYELIEDLWFGLSAREQTIAQIPLVKSDVDKVEILLSHLMPSQIPDE